MKIVQRDTTIGGQPGKGFYLEMTTEERQASERAQWKAGLVKVYRRHAMGRAYCWMPAKEYQLEEYRAIGRISECSEEAYFS